MKKTALLLALFGILNFSTTAQQISGYIYDTKFDRPLEKVNIKIDGTEMGSVSNESGYFIIENVPPGHYRISITRIGYLASVDEVDVSEDDAPTINIYLQPSNITLNNDFVITARRVETDEFESPEAISVINSTMLKQESPRSTPEALEGATGVFMQKTNHGGGSPFIRGLTGNQNLMMIDGIRMNNATFRYGPNQYLNTIDPLTINTIEVVRGSGSVLYGSDAMGGVVQVITKNPAFSGKGYHVDGNIHAKYMTGDMEKSGRAELELASEKIAFLGGFTYNDFGDIVGGDTIGKQTPTGYNEYSADAKLRIKLSENKELTLAYQYDRQDDVPRYDKVISGYTKYHFDPQIRQLGYARIKSTQNNKWAKQIVSTVSFNQS
nr:TonB-dependent receptor plug domain-containing protein [Bacteroidota bacterium]